MELQARLTAHLKTLCKERHSTCPGTFTFLLSVLAWPLGLRSSPSLTPFFRLQEAGGCQHCGGSGCAPCSLCHGSKLSMLANRFNESISDLRCQACYPHGLERCQSCSSKQHRLADARAPQRAGQWAGERRCAWRSAPRAIGSSDLSRPQLLSNPQMFLVGCRLSADTENQTQLRAGTQTCCLPLLLAH